MKRLAIVTTHPIQYYAPLFRLLSEREKVGVRVFYTWEKEAASFDKDFGKEVRWDIPLLEGYDFRFVPNNGNYGKGFFDVKNPTLIKEIEEWKADAVLFFGWNYYSHLTALRHFSGRVQVLFRGDSTLLGEKPGLKRIARRAFLRRVYRYVDTAFYVGSYNKAYFRAHGLREEQLVFAPHAIDNDRFFDASGKYEQEARDSKKQIGVGDDDKVLLYVGKFQETKDPFLLLNAFSEIHDPRWRLLFVGNGELESSLKEKAAADPRILFLPFQNQSRMPVIYRLGDLFCLPSKGETWGLAVNEAMACGRPLLLSDRCGCSPDLVVDNSNGLTFASGDKNDLIGKMNVLFNEGAGLTQRGAASARIIRSWTFDRIADTIEKVVTRQYA